jgi:hypothetical protein
MSLVQGIKGDSAVQARSLVRKEIVMNTLIALHPSEETTALRQKGQYQIDSGSGYTL